MLKPASFLACHIFLCSLVAANAVPADSPGTVYIDGLPCNTACQDYMAWSRRVSGQGSSSTVDQRSLASKTQKAKKSASNSKPSSIALRTGPKRPAKEADALRREAREAKVVAREGKQSTRSKANVEPAATVAIPMPTPDPRPEVETSKAPQDQTATVPAVQDLDVTASNLPPKSGDEIKSIDVNPRVPETKLSEVAETSSTDRTPATAIAPAKAEELIVIVLARPEIKSIAELANKTVAVDASQSSPVSEIRDVIVQAGATDIQISEDDKLALGRVMDGEVPAGVVSIVSPEEAARWTDLPGFNTIRLPFSRAPEKSGPG